MDTVKPFSQKIRALFYVQKRELFYVQKRELFHVQNRADKIYPLIHPASFTIEC